MIHAAMHGMKPLYRRVHQLHHKQGSSEAVSVLSTAHGEVLDVAMAITPFYSLLMLFLYRRPEPWNPLHLAMAAFAVNNVDLMGHCGYARLPPWLYGPASLGVLFTPLAQRPLHHFLHHLDPRVNRSLYFTWWDRLASTFADSHPTLRLRRQPYMHPPPK
jgi:sterol desaturase/sphingolipid hydroxylase (fatty acid hydroxylase superfamily)